MSLSSSSSQSQPPPGEQPEPAMLSARNLFCERDERILFQNLSFDIREGQLLQLRGSNGSGKTTLMRILCGLNDSFSGQIRWYGEERTEQAESFYQSLHYIGHRVGVSKVLNPVENLRWSCSLKGKVSNELIEQTLANLGLRGYEESPCYTLSAGQQQRVCLARLLINPVKFWVLDEPFTTLDRKGVKQFEEIIRNHAKSGGAVLVTTHHNLDIPELDILDLG